MINSTEVATSLSVVLTKYEIELAMFVANQRQGMNVENGAAHRHGADPADGMRLHREGCLGELAVAKALNLFWSGAIGDYGAIDVGNMVEVRAKNRPDHRLILHEDDTDDFPWVSVDVGSAPNISLRGWVMGRDGKRSEWWADPARSNRWAYWVPNVELRPMRELCKLIRTNHHPFIRAISGD